MVGFHAVLGVAVVVLNVLGGAWLLLRRPGAWSVAGLAHAALAIQLVSGFFILTATSGGLGNWHPLVPTFGFVLVMAARAVRGPARQQAVGVASLLAAAAAVFSLVGGFAA